MIREIENTDLPQLLELYLHLHETSVPPIDSHIASVWDKILANDDYHLIVAIEDERIVSSCTCIIVPNLTRQGMSYALIENVVTHPDYRGRGLSHACLDYAKEIAIKNDCYKLMLITGSSDPATHKFYQKAGYSSEGKTAYYQLLKEVPWKH